MPCCCQVWMRYCPVAGSAHRSLLNKRQRDALTVSHVENLELVVCADYPATQRRTESLQGAVYSACMAGCDLETASTLRKSRLSRKSTLSSDCQCTRRSTWQDVLVDCCQWCTYHRPQWSELERSIPEGESRVRPEGMDLFYQLLY